MATVAVCASFAAHAANALIDARTLSPLPEVQPRPVPPRPAAARARPDGAQLVDRDMFCSTCRPGAPDPAGGLPITEATLIATSLGREPYATLAIPASAVQGAWGVGDAIPGLGRLTTGDTLTAINGAPIKSLQQLFDLYAGLDQLSSVEVSGTRAGKPLVRALRLR